MMDGLRVAGIATVATILLTACPTDRGGGGAPRVCGTVNNGDACTVTEDCRCGSSCLTNACVRVVDPFNDLDNPSVRPPTTQMVRICNQLNNLPCYDEPDCEEDLAVSYAEAVQEMCTPQFDAVLNCVDRDPFTCDASNPDPVSTTCENELFAWGEACNRCQTSSGCTSSPQPPPQMDAGTSTTTPMPDPCQVSYSESCRNEPRMSAAADCLQQMDGTTSIWMCRCTGGVKADTTFGIRSNANSCCDLGPTIGVQCGLVVD